MKGKKRVKIGTFTFALKYICNKLLHNKWDPKKNYKFINSLIYA